MRNWKPFWLSVGVFTLIFIFAIAFYKQNFTELKSRNAMDLAQVSRNLTEGKGYTTRFIRPLNTIIAETNGKLQPELNHPPLFIAFETILFKVRSIADQTAGATSFIFLLLTTIACYYLAKILFNRRTGLVAASLFTLSAPVLTSGISGDEWSLAAFLITFLLIILTIHHKTWQDKGYVGVWMSLVSALLSAGLYYTNQVLFVLIIPVFIYFIVIGEQRKRNTLVYIIAFLILCAPWMYINTINTHSPIFGISTWDLAAGTSEFPGDTIYRYTDSGKTSISWISLFPIRSFMPFLEKVIANTTELSNNLILILGFAGFALVIVSIFYKFKSPTVNAIRGVFYGLVAIGIMTFAAFGINKNSIIIFAPIAAVIAGGYLLLLIDTKKMDPAFGRLAIAAFLLLSALPSLKAIIWKDSFLSPKYVATVSFFAKSADILSSSLVYTDVPWQMAWRTLGSACWLPIADSDVNNLRNHELPINVIILTAEVENYSPKEFWYQLYNVRYWRELTKDPNVGFKKYLEFENAPPAILKPNMLYAKRAKRTFAISESIDGFVEQQLNVTQPEYIRIFIGG